MSVPDLLRDPEWEQLLADGTMLSIADNEAEEKAHRQAERKQKASRVAGGRRR